LVVTHDPRILPFADRIVHIEDGRIVSEEVGGAARRVGES
jgi:putative ABC transport system ATP-binding protein